MGNFLPTFYDDVTAIKNNPQVRVDIGTLRYSVLSSLERNVNERTW